MPCRGREIGRESERERALKARGREGGRGKKRNTIIQALPTVSNLQALFKAP
jgi:hypothetical protein